MSRDKRRRQRESERSHLRHDSIKGAEHTQSIFEKYMSARKNGVSLDPITKIRWGRIIAVFLLFLILGTLLLWRH